MKQSDLNVSSPRLVQYLSKSDLYEVKRWTLDFDARTSFQKEFNDCLCAVHMSRGTLTKKMYQLTTGHVTLERPDFEYQLLPSKGVCTIINFSDRFYSQLQDELEVDHVFKKQGKNLLAVQTTASPEAELVLFKLLNNIKCGDGLQLDALVIDFVNEFLKTRRNASQRSEPDQSNNRHHREAIENAKEYLHGNFHKVISLQDLSRHCGISLFYLSRLFKRYTNYSPYQYLSNFRLKHGEMLLKETSDSIADITYASGFTSPEYFATLFKQKYNHAPSVYRARMESVRRFETPA
ncbi:MAG TPA: AraC family transcriptional regulator [Chryseosolibacter sp.]